MKKVINTHLSESTIEGLRVFLLERLGLSYSENHDRDLTRKIGYAAEEFGFSSSILFVEWLLSTKLNDEQLAKLASHLTIGETYFLREKKAFDFLEQIYLPALIHKRYPKEKRLKIWCAGCATGEEAYSLAIVLEQSIPDFEVWDISILASDINPIFLEKAKQGVYTKWSFRSNSESFISKYFVKKGPNEFHILPRIKKMVSFAQINLADEGDLEKNANTLGVDIVFCRNVLIYFSPEGTRRLTENFYKSLIKGGILIVSPVEMSGMISPSFSKIQYAGLTIYQRGEKAAEEDSFSIFNYPTRVQKPEDKIEIVKKEPKGIADNQSDLQRLKKLLPDKILRATEPNKDGSYDEALSLYQKGLFEEAEGLLIRIVKGNQIDGKPAITLLAKIKANLGKLQEAEELCERAMKLDKLDSGLNYLMATVMQEQGNDVKAIDYLNKSIYLDPDFVLAYFLLGNLFMKAGKYENGEKSFRQAIKSLSKLKAEDILPESDGITVGRFSEILGAIKA